MSTAALVAVLLAAIALVVFLIIKLKLHASIALVLAAIFVAIITGMPLNTIMGSIESGVGGILGELALIIGFGAILGKMMEISGGAERIANTLINLLGKQNATWAIMFVGFIAGIPVFVEVGFVLLVPLVFVVAKDVGMSRLQVGIPLAVSLMVVHCIVPPHPAATAITTTLGANIGQVILYGLLVGLPCAIVAGPLFVKFFCSKTVLSQAEVNPSASGMQDRGELPKFSITLLTILLPLLIMVAKTLFEVALGKEAVPPVVNFLGNPIAALLISVFFAYWSLGLARGLSLANLAEVTDKSFTPIAGIFLIIGAGGAFSAILKASGVGEGLKDALALLPISPIVLAWLIAALLHFSVGSATVAMISAAGIVLPMVDADPTLSREIIVIAIGTGAIALTQVTDSLFWLVKEYLGLTLGETIKKFTVATTLASVVGLGATLLLNAAIG